MTETPQPPQPQPQSQPAPAPGAPQPPAVRPGGLTALAVLNFVFGGLGALFSLLAIAGLAALAAAGVSVAIVWVSIILGLVAAAMLIVSGVGYIKMSKASGYSLGMVYAIVAIANVIISLVGGLGFGASAIIGLAYPVLTIILLNTAFKKCFR
jgi:hypothetical protein